MMAHISTERLARIQNGDPTAAAEFYQRFGTQIRQWIRLWGFKGRARSARGSEDVQQSVWLDFQAAVIDGKFRGCEADHILNWLQRVTKNHLVDILRAELGPQRGGGHVFRLSVEPVGSASGVVSALVRREKGVLVQQALAKLEEPDRELLEDRYFRELGVEELAKKYMVSKGTISKRVTGAMARLREVFPQTPPG